MALGEVQINNKNLMQGPLKEVENYLVYLGRGAGTNEGKLISVNTDTDLDAVLGADDFNLKYQLKAARLNAGQNWNAAVLPLAEDQDLREATLFAMEQEDFEAFVHTDPVKSASDLEEKQALATEVMALYKKPVWGACAYRGLENGESWEDFLIAAREITKQVAADKITITLPLWGPELGTYMGRLCNKSVTVADTPMRVKTGPLIGSWADKTKRPKDSNGRLLDMGILNSFDAARFSVPQWYASYDGIYWADGNVLDVEAGDYQVIENVRVIQKCMRRVYPLAVSRIGDRTLNETPASIEAAKNSFTRPLREMSKTRTILGIPFPGEIHPPGDDAIKIVWITKYEVEIWITARPYNCPKKITCNLLLDLTNYA